MTLEHLHVPTHEAGPVLSEETQRLATHALLESQNEAVITPAVRAERITDDEADLGVESKAIKPAEAALFRAVMPSPAILAEAKQLFLEDLGIAVAQGQFVTSKFDPIFFREGLIKVVENFVNAALVDPEIGFAQPMHPVDNRSRAEFSDTLYDTFALRAMDVYKSERLDPNRTIDAGVSYVKSLDYYQVLEAIIEAPEPDSSSRKRTPLEVHIATTQAEQAILTRVKKATKPTNHDIDQIQIFHLLT